MACIYLFDRRTPTKIYKGLRAIVTPFSFCAIFQSISVPIKLFEDISVNVLVNIKPPSLRSSLYKSG